MLYICTFPAGCFCYGTYVAQGLINGVLNETWNHSCLQYKWPFVGQAGLYRGRCPSFMACVYFGLLYLSLIFDKFIAVCVCVLALEWLRVSLTVFFCFVYVCVSWGVLWFLNLLVVLSPFFVYIYTCPCVCVCVFSVFFFRLRTCLT